MRSTCIKIQYFFISISVISLWIFIGLDSILVTILNPCFCKVRGAQDYQVPGREQLLFPTACDITFLVSAVLEVFVLSRTSEIHYDYVFCFCCFSDYKIFNGG
jgi:hypothetical protein